MQMVELLGISGWMCLNGCVIHLLLIMLFVYLVFYLVIDFLARFLNCFLIICQKTFIQLFADEASDSSHKEQMSLVLRFVDDKMDIREEFIAFLHCKW